MQNRPAVGVGVIIKSSPPAHNPGEKLAPSRILLLHRKNVHGAGMWSTPGGHLEFGESPETCAAREAMEETGVEIDNVRFRAITNDVMPQVDRHYITIWMEGRYVQGEPHVQAAYEMDDVGWFPLDALPSPLFWPLQNLLDGKCYGQSGIG